MANEKLGILLTGSAKGAVSAFNQVSASAKKAGSSFAGWYKETRKMNNQLSNISKDANRSATSIKGLSSAVKGFNQVLGGAKLYVLGDTIAKSIKSSLDMIETINLFSVAMGDLAVETDGFVKSMHDYMGLDQTNMQNSVATFNLLARSMGMTNKNAQVLSTNTAKLALDLSSLTNVPINQVMQDLRSGLIGQTETVYKYGMDLTEASLKTEALALGISKSVREMSQGEKMALRYSLMIRQSGLSHGDFARTIDTPANQLRILQERVVTLSRAFGSLFMPALGAILPYLNAFVKVLTSIIQNIAILVGYQAPKVENMGGNFGSVAEEVDGATGSVKKLAKEMKSVLGMDELNVISKPTESSGGGASGGGGALDFDLGGYDNLMDQIKSKTGDIEAGLWRTVEAFKELFKPISMANWDGLMVKIQLVGEMLKPIANMVFTGLINFVKLVLVPMGAWVVNKALPAFFDTLYWALYALQPVAEAFMSFGGWLWDSFLKPVGEWAGSMLIDDLNYMSTLLKDIGNWMRENKETVQTWVDIIGAFAIGVALANISLSLYNILVGASTTLTTALNVVLGKLGLTNPIVLGLTALITVGVLLYKNWDKVKEVAIKAWSAITEALNTAKTGIATALNAIKETFYIIWTAILTYVERAINKMIALINDFFAGLNSKIASINSALSALKLGTIPTLPMLSPVTFTAIPKLASGGMLSKGTLFEAGEFGKSEIIGNHNNQTTVMPLENTDFVRAMYNAVKDAVSDAQGSGGQVIENILTLDGDVIYKNQQKVSQRRGKNFSLGAFSR